MDLLRQYESIADEYVTARRRFFARRKDVIQEFIRGHVAHARPTSLLDVGCGNGEDLVSLRGLGIAEVHGIDPSQRMIALAANALIGSRMMVKLGRWERIPFPANRFECLVGRFSLHYLRHVEIGYREAARVLKRSGMLILAVPHPNFDAVCCQRLGVKARLKRLLYNDSLSVECYAHTFSEYLSPQFLKRFDLIDLREFWLERTGPIRVPTALTLVGLRR